MRQKIEINTEDVGEVLSIFVGDIEYVIKETADMETYDSGDCYTITCKKCGGRYESVLYDGYKYCPHCGRKAGNVTEGRDE